MMQSRVWFAATWTWHFKIMWTRCPGNVQMPQLSGMRVGIAHLQRTKSAASLSGLPVIRLASWLMSSLTIAQMTTAVAALIVSSTGTVLPMVAVTVPVNLVVKLNFAELSQELSRSWRQPLNLSSQMTYVKVSAAEVPPRVVSNLTATLATHQVLPGALTQPSTHASQRHNITWIISMWKCVKLALNRATKVGVAVFSVSIPVLITAPQMAEGPLTKRFCAELATCHVVTHACRKIQGNAVEAVMNQNGSERMRTKNVASVTGGLLMNRRFAQPMRSVANMVIVSLREMCGFNIEMG